MLTSVRMQRPEQVSLQEAGSAPLFQLAAIPAWTSPASNQHGSLDFAIKPASQSPRLPHGTTIAPAGIERYA